MAITTETGAKKIAGTDNWREIFDDHNDTIDAYDEHIAAQAQTDASLAEGMAIVATGNTHTAITSGQYVYVKGHDTLAEGLYKATAAIATNGTLSTSNLAAEPSGALNDLKGQVDSLSSNLSNNVFQELEPTGTRCTVVSGGVAVVGNLAVINVKIQSAYSATNAPSMLSLNVRTPKCVTALSCVKSGATQGSLSGVIACHVGTNRQLYIQSVENDAYYDISGVVVLA